MSTELKKREITPEALYGKDSLIPKKDQLWSVQYCKLKLDWHRHMAQCLDCLQADAHCDQCDRGATLLSRLEDFENVR